MKKTMSLYKIILASLFVLFTSNFLSAQEDDLESGEVQVINNFEASLLETEKVDLNPSLPPLDTTTKRLVYAIPSKSLDVEYLPPTLRPIGMRADKLPDSYNGYAKLGYGIPNSPYAELSYHKLLKEQLDFGIDLFHHSANNNNKIENQRFGITGGELESTYYFDQGFAAGANVGFTSDVNYLYGYDQEVESFNPEDVKQRFNTLELGGKFFNGERTQGDLNYYAGADFYRFTDNFASGESGFDLDLGITKYFADKHPLSLKLSTDFTTFEDTATQKLNNLQLIPNFAFHGDKFKISVGANLLSHNDNFKIYPLVEASASIVRNLLTAFAGWRGDYQKNTFRSLANYNPYMVSRGFDLRNTEFQEFYGGIKGRVKIIEYQGQIGYKQANNLALYLSNPDDTKRFDVLYDTANIVNIQGRINLNIIKDLEFGASLSQSFFDLQNEEKPWHLPALEFNIHTTYKALKEQLLVRGDLYLANGVPYQNDLGLADNLNALFDVSLGAEYLFSKNVGAFVSVNNLLSNNRQRWYRYPTFGLNLMGGITARF